MESQAVAPNPNRKDESRTKTPSLWLVFWLMVMLLIAFGIAGIYLDKRLEMLEQKILAQTGEVSAQTDNALVAMQNARKDILESRAEAAGFAKQYSTTLQDLSGLMTNAVTSFSKQTLDLAQTVADKNQSQAERLNAALADLGKESRAQSAGVQTLAEQIAAAQKTALDSKTQSDNTDRRMEQLTQQLAQMNAGLQTAMAGLSDSVNKQNASVNARLEEQAKAVAAQLASLQDASNRGLEAALTQLAALSQEIGARAASFERTSKTSQATIQGRLSALGETLQTRLDENRKESSTIAARLEATIADRSSCVEKSNAAVADELKALADQMKTGLAANRESDEVLRSELAAMSYHLSGRTEDLLIELSNAKEKQEKQAEELAGRVENRLSALGDKVNTLKEEMAQSRSLASTAK